ncbi:dethiobiotin synthase [Caulobacter sp. KR2-114]|uniref:dethiobiotin synthase n=1 Tax=Caulobacter sp. KR2-114 TaxID=3400912 RepID=UPI003C0A0031
MPALFVAGAHTDVGKTYVACALIRAARKRGLSVDALKPVVSGFDDDDWDASDPGRLIEALGWRRTADTLAALSPWRYRAPLSPPMAASLEGASLDFHDAVRACRRRLFDTTAELMIVEGVGGLMSPVTHDHTGLDLMAALAAPSVMVGGSYLGAISHTLTALAAARAHGVDIRVVVVSESATGDAPFAETVESVARLAKDLPVVAAPRDGGFGFADRVLDECLGETPSAR